jgi:hypothetical protein
MLIDPQGIGSQRMRSAFEGVPPLRERSARAVSIKISRHVTPATDPMMAARLTTSYVPNAPGGSAA